MDLLKDNIPLLVRKLAIPASVGTLFQTFYNIVDTFFAGKISPEALSALSKSFPIYFIIIATSIGVSVAGTSLIGNSIGEKNKKNVLYYFSHIIIYGLIISIFITFLGLYYSEKVFFLMGSSSEVTNLGTSYTDIIFYGPIPRYSIGLLSIFIMTVTFFIKEPRVQFPLMLKLGAFTLSLVLLPRINSYINLYENKNISLHYPVEEIQEITNLSKILWHKPSDGDQCWIDISCRNEDGGLTFKETFIFKTANKIDI